MNGKFLVSGTGETPALHFHWVFLTTSCTEQFEAVEEELDKWRQECQELKVRKEEDAALVTVKTPRGTLRGPGVRIFHFVGKTISGKISFFRQDIISSAGFILAGAGLVKFV